MMVEGMYDPKIKTKITSSNRHQGIFALAEDALFQLEMNEFML